MRNWVKRIFASTTGQADAPDQPSAEPADIAARMHNAGLAFETGDFAAAADICREVLDVSPDNVLALQRLGFSLHALGELQQAETALTRSLDFDSTSPYTHYILGEIAEAQGNIDGACTSWRTTIGLAADFEPAYLGLCRLLCQDGWLDMAIQTASDGITHIPESVGMFLCLGNLHYEKQQFALAQQAYQHALTIQADRADLFANLGMAFLAQSQFAQAIEALEHSIRLEPSRAEVHNNLANALSGAGRIEEALACYAHVASMAPGFAQCWNDWGMALYRLDRPDEAITCFKRCLEHQPAHMPTLFNLANMLHATRQWSEATQYYGQILELAPERIEILCNLGVNFLASGDGLNAAASFRRALVLQPAHVDASFNLGALLQSQGKHKEAVEIYANALEAQPDLSLLRLPLANAYRALGKWMECAKEYRNILRTEPDHVGALFNFGLALQIQGHHDEAIACYHHARELDPDNHDVLINLGAVLEETQQFETALACYEQALLINPSSVEAHINTAAILTLQGRLAESIASFDRALEIAPNNPDAHYSRGLSLLRMGDYKEGWKEYDYRWLSVDAPLKPEYHGEQWLGDSDLQGKTILLYAEQGLGDTIQFVRYVELVAARGAKIVLAVPAALIPLLKGLDGVDRLVAQNEAGSLPAFDFQCALLSLPAAFKSELSTIPKRCPYLYAPSERVTYWMSRLAKNGKPKIGLAWAGNPQHKNDKVRSTPLSNLSPLWSSGNRAFLSLQKDIPARDAALLNQTASIEDLSASLTDFAETAAIIASLDLLITVDSSLAHLAGAMNVPVWIMLPYLPDFRWLMGRQDSPWYPSARLFRQSGTGDWASVVDAINTALIARFGSPGAATK